MCAVQTIDSPTTLVLLTANTPLLVASIVAGFDGVYSSATIIASMLVSPIM
jgi:hypothetical protein